MSGTGQPPIILHQSPLHSCWRPVSCPDPCSGASGLLPAPRMPPRTAALLLALPLLGSVPHVLTLSQPCTLEAAWRRDLVSAQLAVGNQRPADASSPSGSSSGGCAETTTPPSLPAEAPGGSPSAQRQGRHHPAPSWVAFPPLPASLPSLTLVTLGLGLQLPRSRGASAWPWFWFLGNRVQDPFLTANAPFLVLPDLG